MRALNQKDSFMFYLLLLIVSFVAICCLPYASTFFANRFGVVGDRLYLFVAGLLPLLVCCISHYSHCYGLLDSKSFLTVAILSQFVFFLYMFILFFVIGGA
jgi:hypothetical protein